MKLTFFIALITSWLAPQQVDQSGNDKIENFSLVNATNNKTVSLADFANERTVVLIFTSNYCPYARLYEDRIIAWLRSMPGGVYSFCSSTPIPRWTILMIT